MEKPILEICNGDGSKKIQIFEDGNIRGLEYVAFNDDKGKLIINRIPQLVFNLQNSKPV